MMKKKVFFDEALRDLRNFQTKLLGAPLEHSLKQRINSNLQLCITEFQDLSLLLGIFIEAEPNAFAAFLSCNSELKLIYSSLIDLGMSSELCHSDIDQFLSKLDTVWNEGTSRFENCLMDYEKARLQESDGLIEVRNFAVLENLNQYFLKKKNSNGSVQEQKVCDRLYLFYQQTKDTQSKIMKIGLPPVKRTVNRAKSPSWNRISRRRQKWEENPNTALNSVIQRCS